MPAPNRTALLTKIHKALKKLYTPVPANLKMPLLEQLLFACCLENSNPAAAAKAFAALDEQYFDWNEVRVSTVTELAETVSMLSEPVAAASRVKRVLQSVFESAYAFDLETLKKQNIGAAQKRLAKYDGVTPFGVAYATQTGLGGHSIPLGRGALEVLYILGVINEKERDAGEVPGMERAIPKNKGIEFGSVLNQLGTEYAKNPMSPAIRKVLLAIAPDAKDRFPKRAKPESETPAPVVDGKAAADAKVPANTKAPAAASPAKGKGAAAVPPAKSGAAPPVKSTPPAKQPASGKAPAPSKPAAPAKAQGPAKSPPPAKPVPAAKPAAKSQPAPTGKKPPVKAGKATAHSKSQQGRVAPRKPR